VGANSSEWGPVLAAAFSRKIAASVEMTIWVSKQVKKRLLPATGGRDGGRAV